VLGWSLLEAMPCGAAVAASDTGPVREVVHSVVQDKFNATLVEFLDVQPTANGCCVRFKMQTRRRAFAHRP
jgi:hypothetical protein